MISGGWEGLRVLVLSPTPTYPLDFGNRKRIHSICSELQRRGAEIHFVHYASEGDWRGQLPTKAARVMAAQWDSFWTVPPTRPLHSAPAGSHHAPDEWWDPAIEGMLRWLFSAHQFDVLLVNYTWLSRALEFAPRRVLRVIDTHDRFSGRRELFEANGLKPEFFYLTEQGEQQALARADVVWAIKSQEAEFFRTLVQSEVLTVPHAETIQMLSRAAPPRGILRFGIVGARNTLNVTNIRAFLKAADAFVKRTLLPMEIQIAGSCCDLLAGSRLPPWVRLRGRVEVLEEFYQEVDVVLAPMTFSTGLKIKVGEALHLGKALIAHEHAYEGYPALHPFHHLPSFQAMLSACREVVRRPALIEELEEAALRAAAATRRMVSSGLDATAAVASRLRPGVVVVLSVADIAPGSLRLDHACEIARYAGLQTPVYILLQGSPEEEAHPVALSRVAQFGEVLAGPGVGESVHLLAAKLGLGRLRQRSLRALAGTDHVAVWFASPPRPEEPLPRRAAMPAYVHLDAIASAAQPEADRSMLARLAAAFASLTALARSDGLKASAARLVPGVQTLRIPMLFNGALALSFGGGQRYEARGIAVLADRADDPLVGLTVDVLRSAGHAEVEVVVPPEQTGAPTGGSGQPLPQFLVSAVADRRMPALVIDIAESEAFDGVRELMDRRSIARLQAFIPAGAMSPMDSRPRLGVHGLLASIEAIREAARDTRSAVGQLRQRSIDQASAKDAGWTLLWAAFAARLREIGKGAAKR